MTDESKISGRYRELPREEPPRAVDEAILAASRRAVESRPRRWRWAGPLAFAAVLVLVVAVTVQVDREPDGVPVPAGQVPEPPAPAEAFERRAESAPAAPAERSDALGASAGARDTPPERARTQMARVAADEDPELQLERIAKLREAGKHQEADRALEEFRRRYPDYAIRPAMKERIERK